MSDALIDPLNPLCWLSALDSQHFPVLLDSCLPGAPFGRYSVVAAMPQRYFVVTTLQALEEWERQADGSYRLTNIQRGSVIAALSAIQSRVALPTKPNGGFNGGLIGLLNYDLGQLQQGVPLQDHRRQTLSRVIDMPLAWVGDYDHAVVIDHQEQRVLYIGDAAQWQPTLPPRDVAMASDTVVHTSLDQHQYEQRMQRLKDYIAAGDCYQVNLTRQFDAPWPNAPLATYARLRNATPMPFSAYLDLGNTQLLSLSPERFLRIADGQMETKPIKGTRPRSPDPKEDEALKQSLLQSTKDRAENLMIVDLLRNDLGRSAVPGSVKVPKLFDLESFANVHQLVSTVTATLSPGETPLGALLKAFPGGSITGAPKRRAMEIIAELEPHQRGPYCGSIFYQDVTGLLDSNILIRTMAIQDNHLWTWAGGGIVWDSETAAEFEETHDKIRSLLASLGLALP
ncbi:aminodeoxychorismate synthase component I [Salinispirillum sp. LH 10-3-1]|uniref:aminodeoxychorismate synthase n=1 Tax=Salinispirillum sp. LH 10-3-1 TaxID=2952525 RepID=A0AB38YJV8_9GAMM